MTQTWVVGSPAVVATLAHDLAPADADVTIVATAAHFSGATQAAVALSNELSATQWRCEALMVGDRAAAADPYFARRVSECDLVIALDGSALHARSVWRHSSLGEALSVHSRVVGIGAVGSVLGDPMIDPRGGAPTSGLGRFSHVAVMAEASRDEELRTRSLLGPEPLLVVGPTGAVLIDSQWRILTGEVREL
jgi:cyanophycinase